MGDKRADLEPIDWDCDAYRRLASTTMSDTDDGIDIPAIRCYYEVLDVPRDADDDTIKKAHRRLALQHHPDRPSGNATLFRQVQDAYETLTTERQWYDDHREAILKGWTAHQNGGDKSGADYSVPIAHAMVPSFYHQNDGTDFFSAYSRLFSAVAKEEGQADAEKASYLNNLPFGTADSDWTSVVAPFYQTWESFATVRSFAWADVFDTVDMEQADGGRRMRRAMQDANSKARSAARKERTASVQRLVRWVKQRDPRVQARKSQVEQEKVQRAATLEHKKREQKQEQRLAREEWLATQQQELAAMEEQDRLAGRVRLADLEGEDDDSYEYAGGKKKKGKKKKKTNKGKQNNEPNKETVAAEEKSDRMLDDTANLPTDDIDAVAVDTGTRTDEQSTIDRTGVAASGDESTVSDETEEEEEPDEWRCECCRKDFKSRGQMENHLNSKKHKAMYKKYAAILDSMEGATIE